MSETKTQDERRRAPAVPFLNTNVEPRPANESSAEALRNPPAGLRVVIILFAVALISMVVAIAVLKAPGA